MDDYNEYFLNQLFEILTEYGPIHEVWFDGAHPKRKGGQTYNYPAWKKLIKHLPPMPLSSDGKMSGGAAMKPAAHGRPSGT
mgnify:FL=1